MINEMEKIMTIEPNWEKAPAWAGWWAVDREGDAYWWEREPYCKMEKTMKTIEPEMIEPDWTKAPFWAKWWGVNCDKFPEGDDIWACWYENEPKFKSGIWVSPRGRGQEDNAWPQTECDDYRQTLRSRP